MTKMGIGKLVSASYSIDMFDLCSIGGDFLGHGFSDCELQPIRAVKSFTKLQHTFEKRNQVEIGKNIMNFL